MRCFFSFEYVGLSHYFEHISNEKHILERSALASPRLTLTLWAENRTPDAKYTAILLYAMYMKSQMKKEHL